MHVDAICEVAWSLQYMAFRYVYPIKMSFDGHFSHMTAVMWRIMRIHNPQKHLWWVSPTLYCLLMWLLVLVRISCGWRVNFCTTPLYHLLRMFWLPLSGRHPHNWHGGWSPLWRAVNIIVTPLYALIFQCRQVEQQIFWIEFLLNIMNSVSDFLVYYYIDYRWYQYPFGMMYIIISLSSC